MTWELAPAIIKLRMEVDREYRLRNRKSDGTIGNAEHSARQSDHNPNEHGIVCAIDFTHDPRVFHAHKFADALRERCAEGKENRVNYIISKGRIASLKTKFEWVDYDGANPHDKHVHISLRQEPRRYNNSGTWWVKNWFPRGAK
jgi:hypothetical protein